MNWKSPLAVCLLPLCLGFASRALAQRTLETVIVIQDTVLEDGIPPPTPAKRGQSLQVFQRSGGRLWVSIDAWEAPQARSWGWIEARSALPPDQALPHFSRLLQKDPKDATAYLGRAAAEHALGQHGKVIADCDQALRLDRNSISAFQLRARAWIAKEQLDKAIADLGEVLRLDPKRADAYRGGATCGKSRRTTKRRSTIIPACSSSARRTAKSTVTGVSAGITSESTRRPWPTSTRPSAFNRKACLPMRVADWPGKGCGPTIRPRTTLPRASVWETRRP